MSIELRWFVPSAPGPQTARLQYRQWTDNSTWGGTVTWSEWADVPTVIEPPPHPVTNEWPQVPIIFTGRIR